MDLIIDTPSSYNRFFFVHIFAAWSQIFWKTTHVCLYQFHFNYVRRISNLGEIAEITTYSFSKANGFSAKLIGKELRILHDKYLIHCCLRVSLRLELLQSQPRNFTTLIEEKDKFGFDYLYLRICLIYIGGAAAEL